MTRRRVFIDTWAWVAAAVVDDAGHPRVVELGRQLHRDHAVRYTSLFVLAEAYTRLRYDASLAMALDLAAAVDEMVSLGDLVLVPVDDQRWSAALTWFRRFADQRFSFVDSTSFAIMADLGLTEALTSDTHFATAGFVPLGAV